MEGNKEYEIKGAASEHAESEEAGEVTDLSAAGSQSAPSSPSSERVEAEAKKEDTETQEAQDESSETKTEDDQLRLYRWCKCFCDPALFNGQNRYFLHLDTHESLWEEPREPYWIWDTSKQTLDESGLQHPAATSAAPNTSAAAAPDGPDPTYSGYNPKIHGSYDPNADYAQYHNRKREEEDFADHGPDAQVQAFSSDHVTTGTFNRFTGEYQTADKSTERHNDYNKSGRQMGSYFDVDAAANAHDGRSLKDERRNEKLSKKQIKEMAEKRRAKKEKKRMDFYKS